MTIDICNNIDESQRHVLRERSQTKDDVLWGFRLCEISRKANSLSIAASQT